MRKQFCVTRSPIVHHRATKNWRNTFWQLTVIAVFLSLSGYFAYHALNGRFGIEARSELLARATALDYELNKLEQEKARLRQDIALLQPGKADPAFVGELARDMLGYAQPNERIVNIR